MSGISRRGCGAEDRGRAARGRCGPGTTSDPGTAGVPGTTNITGTTSELVSIGRVLNRRQFIGTVGVTAVVALVPTVTPTLTTTGPATSGAAPQLLDDWSIDDMFGVWPRYADPIPHGNSWPDDTDPGEPLNAL